MESPKHFHFRSFKWHCDVWFYPDRIESAWDEWGLGVQKGKKTVLKDQLQPTISESTTFGFRARGSFYRVAQFVCVAAAVWFLAPVERRAWIWLPVALAIPPFIIGLTRLRKKLWLNLQTKDGSVALALDSSSWQQAEITEFKQFFGTWLDEPIQRATDNDGVAPRRV